MCIVEQPGYSYVTLFIPMSMLLTIKPQRTQYRLESKKKHCHFIHAAWDNRLMKFEFYVNASYPFQLTSKNGDQTTLN